MSKYFMYGNSGGICEVIETLESNPPYYTTLKDCFQKLVTDSWSAFSIEDLSIKYHAFDERINKDVYMITTKRFGKTDYIKEYGTSQFFQYLIEL